MLFFIKISSIEDWSRWLGRTRPCFIRGSTFFLLKTFVIQKLTFKRNVMKKCSVFDCDVLVRDNGTKGSVLLIWSRTDP